MNRKLMHSLTGLFLLAVLVLVLFSIVSLPDLQEFFGRIHEVKVRLPEAYVAKGNPVFFRKYRVGSVVSVTPTMWSEDDPDNWFVATIGIDRRWGGAITDAFSVTVDMGALEGLTGAKLLLLAPLEAAEGVPVMGPFRERQSVALSELPPGKETYLAFQRPTSWMESVRAELDRVLRQTVPRVQSIAVSADGLFQRLADPQGDLLRSLESLRASADRLAALLAPPDGEAHQVIAQASALARRLNDPEGPLASALAQLEAALRALNEGPGAAAAILHDEQLASQTAALLEDARAAAAELNEGLRAASATLDNVRAASQALPALAEDVKRIIRRLDEAARVLPESAEDVRAVIEEAGAVLRAIERLPILRSYVETAEEAEPIVLPAMTTPPNDEP
ncbi:MAG: hypothetical protein HY812_17275 [Planctomycetes bacterium]|nr:hypothetical protein [Planctomycetota bacterium]